MALIFPDKQTIKKMLVPPTPGEAALLNFLIKNLSDAKNI